MKFKLALLLLFGLMFSGFQPAHKSPCLTTSEKALLDLVQQYRKSKGLKPIPVSEKLMLTARAHVKDLNLNHPDTGDCNTHSWSNKGIWSACCYTPDHAMSAQMWNKPKQIAGYNGNGFEIAFWSSNDAQPAEALAGWKSSPPHNEVIINKGVWKQDWKAVGLAIDGNYACVWFGYVTDSSDVRPCP